MKNMLWLAAAALMTTTTPTTAAAATLQDSIRADMPMLLALYRDIHANPELSMQETRTAGLAADRLRTAGYEVTTDATRIPGA